MSLVFLNSFERKQEGKDEWARVSIADEEGNWRISWMSQEQGQGQEPEERKEELWFEGDNWACMMEAFRMGVKSKLAEGYAPLIDTKVEERSFMVSRRVQLFYCYSESHYHADAFEQLRLWRKEQARQESKSAYILASNRILQMIATFLPHTEEELAQIPGIGQSRLAAYGEAILAITREYPRETPFPLDWVAAAIPAEDFAAWQSQTEKERSRQQADKLETRKLLLEKITQGCGLGQLAKELKMGRKDLLATLELMERDGYDISPLVDAELDRITPEEREHADKLFCELGDRYLRPVVTRLLPDGKPGDREVDRAYEWLRLYRLHYRRKAVEGRELLSPVTAQA
ncbi:HRDC domain-containing protein [Gorillibacterium sp. CAU 1737]|uniref:HRDC domain-containing protein n=1 Tax=Gorillibacterium sp. CAU 1737 TaxID=3140362 RepID=UPI003261D41F